MPQNARLQAFSKQKVSRSIFQGIYTVAQLQILQGVVVAAVEYARFCEIYVCR
jgi:hypothetical protein